MYFICGIHGAGKTSFARELSQCLNVGCYSAGSLIMNKSNDVIYDYKKVSSVEGNQRVLLEAINDINDEKFIIDGHLCLINSLDKIERIERKVFLQMHIERLYIVIAQAENIVKNLRDRDEKNWSLEFIERFQKEEIEYACELSEFLNVPLKIIYQNKEINNFAVLSKDNILLPIKPCYADKIFEGAKKYEYRKRLCKNPVKKVYIYATYPVKAIVGEADVIEKMTMPKKELWNITKEQSGISLEFFNKYFENREYACAYHLENVKKYDKPILLKSVGINYVPQSYVYIGDIVRKCQRMNK